MTRFLDPPLRLNASYQSLPFELDFPQNYAAPLHANKAATIQIVADPIFHERTKHVKADFLPTQEDFDNSIITLPLFL